MTPRDVYIVGSVPLPSSAAVFETLSAALGPHLRWLPDGETGPRLDWVASMEWVFSSNPALVPSGKLFQLHPQTPPKIRYRLRGGAKVEELRFPNLGYADAAIASYADFARLKAAGRIPTRVKFQVDLVPAHSVLWLFLDDDLHAAVDPIYNRAVLDELARITAAIPHDQLAIQFDVASAVFARLERGEPSSYGRTKVEMQETFSRILIGLAACAPRDVDLLFHLCYGDANHRHVVEPTDMSDMVDFANRVCANLDRPVQLFHFPAPRDRTDDAYYAPLARLRLHPKTSICIGLVHHTDGVAGTRARLETAKRHCAAFLIGTECGFGRRPPETLAELLAIHAEVARAA